MAASLEPRLLFALGFVSLGSLASPLHAQYSLSAWGSDVSHQVSSTPSGHEFIQADGGAHHSVALRADGSIVSWGVEGQAHSDQGQVFGTPGGTGFTHVSAGDLHSLALRSDGSIVSWGPDSDGIISNTPSGVGFVQAVAGGAHSLALDSTGAIVSWGNDQFGQISNTPAASGFIHVAAGGAHSLALRSDGTIVSWGWDALGQVSGAPVGAGFVQLAGGGLHSVALHSTGMIVSWGSDTQGVVSNTPGGLGFTQVAAGAAFSIAIGADDSVVAWGSDQDGQVSGIPTPFLFRAAQVSTGSNHVLALRLQNGFPFCFGSGTSSQACPCAAVGPFLAGCPNSAGTGASLFAQGHARISSDSFRLEVSELPANSLGLILRGAIPVNGGAGNPAGEGLLCVRGQTALSQVQAATTAGTMSFTTFRGSPFGASSYSLGAATNYQLWYRDAQNTCSGSGFNFSNAWVVGWLP